MCRSLGQILRPCPDLVNDTFPGRAQESVFLTSAPEGSSVVKNGNTFTVKVPANKVTSLKSTVSFKVSNTKDTYTSYVYKPSNDIHA